VIFSNFLVGLPNAHFLREVSGPDFSMHFLSLVRVTSQIHHDLLNVTILDDIYELTFPYRDNIPFLFS